MAKASRPATPRSATPATTTTTAPEAASSPATVPLVVDPALSPSKAASAVLQALVAAVRGGTKPVLDVPSIEALIARLNGQRATPPPPAHDATCNSLVKHDMSRDEAEAAMRAKFATIDADFRTDAVLEAMLAKVEATYACNCALSKRSASGRAPASRTGKQGVTIDGVHYESLGKAARWLAANVPTAERCIAYVARVDSKKTANARTFIEADLAANRLPGVEVAFDA